MTALTAGDRTTLIADLHDELSALATTAGFAAGEADYGNALDKAIRVLSDGTDITELEDTDWRTLANLFEQFMLRKLLNYYTVQVDVSVGPRRESLSQIKASIELRIKPLPISIASKFEAEALDLSESTEGAPLNLEELGLDMMGWHA